MSRSSSWNVCLRENPQARIRLVCFPYAGGGANAFRPWVSRLPDWVEPWAVRYPGREARWEESLFTDAGLLASEIAGASAGLLESKPCAFFGHSLGALLSFETCLALSSQGLSQPVRLIVSGRRAPSTAAEPPFISNLPEKEFLERLRNLNGTPPEVLAHGELMEILAPILRADFKMDETYIPTTDKVTADLSIYGGRDDAHVPYDALSAWGLHTTGASTIHWYPGDHFYFKDPTTPMFAVMAEELLNCL